jgi:glycosyltransferase involved in cell wall biosynthesis
MPRVSIVTPCYAAEVYLARTIESVLGQSMTDWEMVIVDDGSPGDVSSVVAPYSRDPRLKLISQLNGGLCNARNSGAAACSPDSQYLLFLDADDCLEAEMLATMVRYLDAHPDVSLAFCERILIDAADELIPEYRDDLIRRYVPTRLGVRKLEAEEPATPFESFFGYSIAVPSVSLLRRSAYEAVGAWDESLGPFFEDTDMWLRLTLHGPGHYVPRKMVRRRLHGNQITRSPVAREQQRAGTAKFERKWRSADGLSPAERLRVKRARRFKEGRVVPFLWFSWARENLRRGSRWEACKCLFRGCRQLALHLPGVVLSARLAAGPLRS